MSEIEPIEQRLRRFAAAPSDADWQDVLRRAGMSMTRSDARRPRFRPTGWRLVAALVVIALALALPALALSGALSSLFGVSNHGTPVHAGPAVVGALDGRFIYGYRVSPPEGFQAGKPDTFVRLASRDGIGIYAARAKKDNHLCFWDGYLRSIRGQPPNRLYLGSVGCSVNDASLALPQRLTLGQSRRAEARANEWMRNHPFPSPARPLLDLDSDAASAGVKSKGNYLTQVVGVAANGVHSVQLLALSDCHPVVTVPVINNIYIATHLPKIAEAFLVARDAHGKVIWHSAQSDLTYKRYRVPLDPKVRLNCGFG